MTADFKAIIQKATKAPSGHNTQPWKFKVEENTVCILSDYSRRLPVVDADNHALFISLGCALENLVIAAEHYGYGTRVQVLENGEMPITVQLVPGGTKGANQLFDQIDLRQSTRNDYNGAAIPEADLDLLQAAAGGDDARCLLITDHQQKEEIIKLVEEACVAQMSNKDFVAELVHWIRFNQSKAEATNDGLYGASTGNPPVPEWFGKFIMGITLSPQKEAAKAARQLRSSSALVLFIGARNDIKTWINVGRSFERFALTATLLNINMAHENMPCEELPVREKLAAALHLADGEQPLLLLRIGYSVKMPYSYRRPVEEVMLGAE